MIVHLIVGGGLGGMLGYTIDYLAIKMLFHPKREWRVMGRRVPFTPGLFVARREEYIQNLSLALLGRFCDSKGVLSALGQAERAGVIDRMISNLPSIARGMAKSKYMGLTKDDVLLMCDVVASEIKRSSVVPEVVRSSLASVSEDEIEDMLLRELVAIRRFGFVLGASIGVLQVLVEHGISLLST